MEAIVRMPARLIRGSLDEGSAAFQPSNLEVTSIDVGTPAFNIIPAEARLRFNIRFNDHWTIDSLKAWLKRELDAGAAGARYEFTLEPPIDWFLTRSEVLIGELAAALKDAPGRPPHLPPRG